MPASLALVQWLGSGTSGANSYASFDEIIDFAAYRNVDLTTVDENTVIGWAILGMDFIESFRDEFQGSKTNPTQPLQWPRTAYTRPFARTQAQILIDGNAVAVDEIPQTLVNAQCQLVIEQSRGVKLQPTSNPNAIVKTIKIGPITREFFASDNQPLLPAFIAFLSPLLNFGTGMALHTVRV